MASEWTVPELHTDRLVLRAWRDDDLEPFARLNADPEVMRHFPGTLDRAASDLLARRIRRTWSEGGAGLWAVEVPGTAGFIGFIGLAVPGFDPPFGPCVEVGWRLAKEHWGRGYAPEGARAALRYGFTELGLEEIVSFTSPGNLPSRRVMEKVGMHRDPADDFEHPSMPVGHRLRTHVLYRLRRAEWERGWESGRDTAGAFDGEATGR